MTAALTARAYVPFHPPSAPRPTSPMRVPPPMRTVHRMDEEDAQLGQFIPIHYHHQMLDNRARIEGFAAAIDHVVKPGMKVLELGAGTGVLSFFAARAGAARVYSVERIPHVARAARRFIAANGVAPQVEIVDGDAATYLPPEPVDVVICEMLHAGMLREKQLTVIAAFKQRYLARFGGPLPRFIPEAAVMAVQPLMTDFQFHGYQAPVSMFIDVNNVHRPTNLAPPALYSVFSYDDAYPTRFVIDQDFVMAQAGTLNSLRFITKNLLAMVCDEGRSVDWDMPDLVIPLATPLAVQAADVVRVAFAYDAGDSLLALAEAIDQGDPT